MGCDIHAVFQAKRDDAWEDIVAPYDHERWYGLFAWLADVRNHFADGRIDPLVEAPRGLPSDFQIDDCGMHRIPSNAHRGTLRSKYHMETDANPDDPDCLLMSMGDHSFSWLLSTEILAESPSHELFPDFVAMVRTLQAEHGTVRMVFGFDS